MMLRISPIVVAIVKLKRVPLAMEGTKVVSRQATVKMANTTVKAFLRPRWVLIAMSSALSKRGPYLLFAIPKLYSIDGAQGEANVIKLT